LDKPKTITIIGIILGAFLFLGFYISNVFNFDIIGVPSLENFIAMIGILVFIISGFFYFSLKTINQ